MFLNIMIKELFFLQNIYKGLVSSRLHFEQLQNHRKHKDTWSIKGSKQEIFIMYPHISLIKKFAKYTTQKMALIFIVDFGRKYFTSKKMIGDALLSSFEFTYPMQLHKHFLSLCYNSHNNKIYVGQIVHVLQILCFQHFSLKVIKYWK